MQRVQIRDRVSARVGELSEYKKLSRARSSCLEEKRRDAERRLPSTQRDLIHSLPRLLPVFACVYICVYALSRIYISMYMCGGVGRSVTSMRKKRERNRQDERGRKRGEKRRSREQGCTRALFACVYDVNIIRQTHLNRLKILTFTSRSSPLCELSARCTRLYKSAFNS